MHAQNFITQRTLISFLAVCIFTATLFAPHAASAKTADVKNTTHVTAAAHKPSSPVILGMDASALGTPRTPQVLGLAPSASVVDMYIDDTFVGHASVSHSKSHIGHFAFHTNALTAPHLTPAQKKALLKPGQHRFTAVTRHLDPQTKKTVYSSVSAPFYFNVPAQTVLDVRTVPPETALQYTHTPTYGGIKNAKVKQKIVTATQHASSPVPPESVVEPVVPAEESAPNNANISQENSINTVEATDPAVSHISSQTFIVLQVIGWIALVLAAGLFVYQVRRHRTEISRMLEVDNETNIDKK